MSDSVTAYYDHLSQVEARKNYQKKLLQKYGMGGPEDDSVYALTYLKSGQREFLVGTRGEPLLATRSISVSEVIALLKDLKHNVKQVVAEED